MIMQSGANALGMLDIIGLLAKISVILLVLWVGLALLRQQSAARRMLAAQLGVLALLILPLVWRFLPPTQVMLPLAWSAISDAPLVLPDLPGLSYLAPAPELIHSVTSPPFPWARALLSGYVLIASLLLLRIVLGIGRLYRLQAMPPGRYLPALALWQAELQRQCQQAGLKRPVRLLVSAQISSPISWGIWHPVIMIDVATLEQVAPPVVISHELSHIAHFDWISLTLARVVVALYWFHPLVWLMLRHLSFNLECATDDRVLQSGAMPSGYAATLMQISQRAQAVVANANPLAGQGQSLMARIMAVLEPQRPRQQVGRGLWLVSGLLTLLLTLPFATLALTGEQIVWPVQWFVQTATLSSQAGRKAADELDKLGNPNFSALAAAMRSANYQARHSRDVPSFRQRAAIAPMVLALHDPDPVVRRLALWGLSEMRFRETAAVVARLLDDADPQVRAEAAGALGDIGNSDWSFKLIARLRDPDPAVRASAAHALGDLADRSSISALQAALHDSDAAVVEQVKWALAEM